MTHEHGRVFASESRWRMNEQLVNSTLRHGCYGEKVKVRIRVNEALVKASVNKESF